MSDSPITLGASIEELVSMHASCVRSAEHTSQELDVARSRVLAAESALSAEKKRLRAAAREDEKALTACARAWKLLQAKRERAGGARATTPPRESAERRIGRKLDARISKRGRID